MIDPLSDIRQYSQKLTISKLLRFFEMKEMKLTKGMVQNYIRDELLPPPVDKRYYSHKHIVQLTLILRLKTVFDIATIKKVLALLADEDGVSVEAYEMVHEQQRTLMESIESNIGHVSVPSLMLLAAAIREKMEGMQKG